MKFTLKDDKTGGDLLLFKNEPGLDRHYFSSDRFNKYFTIAWNAGPEQVVTIDNAEFVFPSNHLLTLLFNQSFRFQNSEDILAWQFNREFYCIIDHDSEVSCVGFLFGSTDHLFISLDDSARQKMQLLADMFTEEFRTADNVQNEMLLVLLKRLIINVTRLARTEYVPEKKLQGDKFHLIRKFNLLVEAHFKTQHSVSFYAQELCKSPKTLSNLFALFNSKTPSQIIQERIVIEAKRLLTYTNKSIKNITFELGFEDVSHFSNFFKKHLGFSPGDFKKTSLAAQ